MAGRGPAPKQPDKRRGRAAPQRGDWTELPQQTNPPPPLPEGEWSKATEEAWNAWWSDPASTQWSEQSDKDLVIHLARLHEIFVSEAKAAVASEIRQIRDSLGLTPKGRQDRRWKMATEEQTETVDSKKATRIRVGARK